MVLLAACGLGGLANLAMNQGLATGEASSVLAVIEAFLVLTLVGERVVLKEKEQLGAAPNGVGELPGQGPVKVHDRAKETAATDDLLVRVRLAVANAHGDNGGGWPEIRQETTVPMPAEQVYAAPVVTLPQKKSTLGRLAPDRLKPGARSSGRTQRDVWDDFAGYDTHPAP
jgi:hypothetical protein